MAMVVAISQIVFAMVAIFYFVKQMRGQKDKSDAFYKNAQIEEYRLLKLRQIRLNQPLSTKTKPSDFEEIVGQEKGILALRAALCGPYPQHVIIYGPPGVGKTAAARVVLEEAKKTPGSPFRRDAKFVETDATVMRFDERGIADPLIGSVHDPIYQGAGSYGGFGVPQPKPGAATRAHGGILFIDEIGELHPVQMNKLLKVLEEGKVYLESAYYNPTDKNTPPYIKDVFDNGLPADFRLIGATTRQPSEIPPAIRSRCVEIFFEPLSSDHIYQIVMNTARKSEFGIEDKAVREIARFAENGRDAVNIVQIAAGIANLDHRNAIVQKDVEWVVEFSKYSPRSEQKVGTGSSIGRVNGLAVSAGGAGTLMEIEVKSHPARPGRGKLTMTGMVEEEVTEYAGQQLRRKSTAVSSVQNVMTVLEDLFCVPVKNYDIHINFPGGMPVDGPSAGIALLVAVYSSLFSLPVSDRLAMTGEVSIRGRVCPVGGVVSKVEAARNAGAGKVLIPAANAQKIFETCGVEVATVASVEEVLEQAFGLRWEDGAPAASQPSAGAVLSASGAE